MNVVEARNLGIRRGDLWVARGAAFTVPEGAFVAVLGPNGAGKSSLLLTALGLLEADEGELRLFGKRPEDMSPNDVGYVPQTRELDRRFPARAWELVATGMHPAWPGLRARARRDRALASMADAGVDGLADRPISALSGGELQRVYLARCFVRAPKLMLLDEPAAGMDIAGEAAMYHLLEAYQKKQHATVLMVTHDWEGARLHASHVLIVAGGEVLFAPPGEVRLEERLLHLFGHRGHARETHTGHHHA